MFAAVASRFYFSVEQQFSLPGAALFYGCVSLIGYNSLGKNLIFLLQLHGNFIFDKFSFRFMVMSHILPETEDRSLNDIEIHYSNNSRSITDIKIQKVQDA